MSQQRPSSSSSSSLPPPSPSPPPGGRGGGGGGGVGGSLLNYSTELWGALDKVHDHAHQTQLGVQRIHDFLQQSAQVEESFSKLLTKVCKQCTMNVMFSGNMGAALSGIKSQLERQCTRHVRLSREIVDSLCYPISNMIADCNASKKMLMAQAGRLEKEYQAGWSGCQRAKAKQRKTAKEAESWWLKKRRAEHRLEMLQRQLQEGSSNSGSSIHGSGSVESPDPSVVEGEILHLQTMIDHLSGKCAAQIREARHLEHNYDEAVRTMRLFQQRYNTDMAQILTDFQNNDTQMLNMSRAFLMHFISLKEQMILEWQRDLASAKHSLESIDVQMNLAHFISTNRTEERPRTTVPYEPYVPIYERSQREQDEYFENRNPAALAATTTTTSAATTTTAASTTSVTAPAIGINFSSSSSQISGSGASDTSSPYAAASSNLSSSPQPLLSGGMTGSGLMNMLLGRKTTRQQKQRQRHQRQNTLSAPTEQEQHPQQQQLLEYNELEEQKKAEELFEQKLSIDREMVHWFEELLDDHLLVDTKRKGSKKRRSSNNGVGDNNSGTHGDGSDAVEQPENLGDEDVFTRRQQALKRANELIQQHKGRVAFAVAMNNRRERCCVPSDTDFYDIGQLVRESMTLGHANNDPNVGRLLMNMSQTFFRMKHVEYRDSKRPSTTRRQYLQEHLRNHPVWREMRFWEAAFYDSLSYERSKMAIERRASVSGGGGGASSSSFSLYAPSSPSSRSPLSYMHDSDDEKWKNMDTEKQQEVIAHHENMVFGLLGSFAFNMLSLGMSLEDTKLFVEKMCMINSLSEEYSAMVLSTLDATNDHVQQQLCERAEELPDDIKAEGSMNSGTVASTSHVEGHEQSPSSLEQQQQQQQQRGEEEEDRLIQTECASSGAGVSSLRQQLEGVDDEDVTRIGDHIERITNYFDDDDDEGEGNV